jgi:hypothetical protein
LQSRKKTVLFCALESIFREVPAASVVQTSILAEPSIDSELLIDLEQSTTAESMNQNNVLVQPCFTALADDGFDAPDTLTLNHFEDDCIDNDLYVGGSTHGSDDLIFSISNDND